MIPIATVTNHHAPAARAATVAQLEETRGLMPGPVRNVLLVFPHEVLLPQNYAHWPLTVHENITLGQPSSRVDDEVRETSAAADADEVVVDKLGAGLAQQPGLFPQLLSYQITPEPNGEQHRTRA